MRIFVTGGTGFIGAHFIEHALAQGHQLTALYREEGARQQAWLRDFSARGVLMQRGDILQPHTFQDALADMDCVCHFAAAFREAGADEDFFNRLNVGGTVAVAQAAAARGVKRFVLCGTAGVYGQRVAGVIDERSPLQPWNEYERSKVAAEDALRRICAETDMEYVILRPTAVYGPRDERLQKLFRSVAKGRFPLFGRGEGRRHMVYVEDLADAFLRACTTPAAANDAFIIGGPQAVTLREMLDILARAAGQPGFGPRLPLKPMQWAAAVVEDACKMINIDPPIYRRRMDFYLNDAAFDCSHARQVLGWRAATDLDTGFKATLASMR
jgi:nucleoside-diphosphate-sugar epimerase